jgi:hypothetical protein
VNESGAPQPAGDPPDAELRHRRRLDLIFETGLFQAKLLADGLRDILLVPVSIAATLLGLVAGGDTPDRWFREVLRLGRRSERFINLFGHHRLGPTADRLAAPLRQSLEAEFSREGGIRKSADRLNSLLDSANTRARARTRSEVQDSGTTPPELADDPKDV